MAVTPAATEPWLRRRRTWLAWVLWALAIAGLVVTVWLDQLLRQAARPELVVLIPTAIPPVLGAVSTATVGRSWPAAGPVTRWAGCCLASACL
jgi:uncharacterized SAM-binding protein YcdF (DUF218 family)